MSNKINLDVETCLHNISMEYAKRDLDEMIAQNRVAIGEATGCLNCLFDGYVRAYGYLSKIDDAYIKMLLEST